MNPTGTVLLEKRSENPSSAPPQSILRRYFNAYRLAAYVLVLFTVGHTLGAVLITPRFGSESDSVVSRMKSVSVNAQGASCTWYGFYSGFGWLVSVFFLFSVAISWHMGGRAIDERAGLAPITSALFLSHAAGTIIAWAYFFPAPRLLSTLTTLLLGIGCIQDWRRLRHSLSLGVTTNLGSDAVKAARTV